MGAFAEEFREILRAEWECKGFQHVRSFRWVEQTPGPIRRIFEFQAIGAGGHTRSACWGFSLDFVPKFRGRQLRWKRTAKSAEFDLCIDPIDSEGRATEGFSFSYIEGPDRPPSRDLLSRLVGRTAHLAGRDFVRVTTVDDVIRVFEERAEMKFRRFSLDNYVQTHIAWGLALVATGRQAEGQAHILRFCEHFKVEWGHPILLKAEAEALRLAGGASS